MKKSFHPRKQIKGMEAFISYSDFFVQDSGLRPLEHGIRDDNQAGEEEQRFKTEVTSNLSTSEWSEKFP